MKTIGILGAMAQEIDEVKKLMTDVKTHEIGGRTFFEGDLQGKHCVVAFSKWGKVAATMTSVILITVFKVDEIVFIGTAGGIAPGIKVGDVVVANRLVQHDVDSRPMQKQFEIPQLNKIYIETDSRLRDLAMQATQSLIERGNGVIINKEKAAEFSITNTTLHRGDVASGDKFINSAEQRDTLLSLLPDVKCVEMEGAAVAQACCEFDIPFVVIRIISDSADGNAHFDFGNFIKEVANAYSTEIIIEMLKRY